jgi:L-amino acid N-acyltransferase YncA
VIRLASPDDAAPVAAIYRPIVETTAISFEEGAPSDAEMRERIERTLRTYPWVVADGEDGVIGYAYAGRWRERAAYRWTVETTAYVRDDARGRGVGRALYAALFRVLAVQRFHRAFAGITLPNDASVALHRAAGFTDVGVYRHAGYKHGAWHDVGWFERALAEPAQPPGEPIALAALTATALDAALGA